MRWTLGDEGRLVGVRTARRWLPLAMLVLVSGWGGSAHADGVAQVLTSKTIPEATVALIDPESGTSSGGGATDVKVAAGDVVLFRFKYFPVPDKVIHGLQGYLTEYIPGNTQVVGVRIIDANGLTIPPRFPGIANDGCGRPCNGFNSVPSTSGARNLADGSISQVYADTGIFYSTAASLARNPSASFLTFKNGVLMNPEPINLGAITGLLGTTSPVYAHNAWDWVQARAYGTSGSGGDFSGNSGRGNTPYLYGSPVAGAGTYYRYEATETAPGVIQFNDVVGPWNRIRYPGSQIGSGVAATGSGNLARTNVATSSGFDVSPSNPLPLGTRAVRLALGEVRVGEPGFAEIALRVNATPLDPVQARDVDCAETFGGDTSAASSSVRARDNLWPNYLASPACVYLNLLFDLAVDKPLATTGDVLTYTLHGKNLSTATQTGAVPKLKYDSNDVTYVAGSAPGATVVTNCDGDGKTCLVWPAMTLTPSAEYTLGAKVVVGGTGHVTNVMFANYVSSQLPAPGFTTQAPTVVRQISVVQATLQAAGTVLAGGVVPFTGTVSNTGSGAGSYESFGPVLPAGWAVSGPVTLGGVTLTCSAGCGTNAPTYAIGVSAFLPAESRALSFSASVPGAATPGLYDVDVQLWSSQSMFGGSFETYFSDLAVVAVGAARSMPPVVRCPIPTSATSIGGTTTEANGTAIRLYFNGIGRGTATASAGNWASTDFASFGALYGGLEVRATAQAPGELESLLSDPCVVSFVPQCSDGLDNDADGVIDFPADPGCDSPLDTSEVNVVPQCSDGIDNDGDGATDFPADPGCSTAADNTESGPPACGNGVDDDGDGLVDYPADPGCTSATDRDEISYPACSDGVDNDGDGRIDYPADPGCHASNDDAEVDAVFTSSDVKPRLLIAFDTSGSMNWNTCSSTFTGGDGSLECAGADVACAACGEAGCGNTGADDSRLHKVKTGLTQVVQAFGEVDYALMRFHQRAVPFACPSVNASLPSGGWQGSYLPPCGGGFSAGDLLVSFDPDNRGSLLAWMDGRSNYPGMPPARLDTELRGSGTTPLGGILTSALDELGRARGADPRGACRPYRVVLVTDGDESCGGNPTAAAAALLAAGIRVYVIGFATADATMRANLDAIAAAGGTGSAVVVDDAVALSSAMAGIVSDAILIERCNDRDDDCDGLVDEDFPDKGATCGNGQTGTCRRTSTRTCSADGLSTVCTVPAGIPGTETCPPNGVDDDCNNVVDDVPGGCGTCTPEICNGIDDDCNGARDDLPAIFPCSTGAPNPANCQCPSGKSCANPADLSACWCPPACGAAVGVCQPGVLACTAGRLVCTGGNTGSMETCNGADDDCNGVIDGFTRACYPTGTAGCNATTGACMGICRLGIEACPRLTAPAGSNAFGACMGAVRPGNEICNGLDDDCDGVVDDVPGGCGMTCIPKDEICNGLDDNCNGIVDDGVAGDGDSCVVGLDPAQAGVGTCKAGRKRCVGGSLQCEGSVGPTPEICDGKDNNCDGQPDVGAPCPTSFACIEGACQPVCGTGEFPCPADRRCVDVLTRDPCPGGSACLCLPNACLDAACDSGSQTCVLVKGAATCVDRCAPDKCLAPLACVPATGRCVDCYSTGCPDGLHCLGAPGVCKADSCAGVTCAGGQACQDGVCKASCAGVTCPAGQACSAGVCTVSLCDNVACDLGDICNPENGRCEPSRCVGSCPVGATCVPKTGACVSDPCQTTRCPACSVCRVGFEGGAECVADQSCTSIAIGNRGAGCACSTGGGPEQGPLGALAVALMLALAFARRRLATRRASGKTVATVAGVAVVGLALVLGGCQERTFRITFGGLGSDGGAERPSTYIPPGMDASPHADRPDDVDGGTTDADTDACVAMTDSDPGNCGACGNICRVPGALPACTDGQCVVGECLPGFSNLNGRVDDGCEYACTVTQGGSEVCDDLDNDCDGLVDELHDKRTDLENCGACGRRCVFLHAASSCADSVCVLGACGQGFVNANQLAEDGCECAQTNAGMEICDGMDNDCNGSVDDVPAAGSMNDVQHCGACNRNCTTLPHAVGTCSNAACVIAGCAFGFADRNNSAADGCEHACPGGWTGGTEVCDGIDNDCDGKIDADDESMTPVANFCATRGECASSKPVCTAGRWLCDYGPGVELTGPNEVIGNETRCDGKDNDCDGCIDETFPEVGLAPAAVGGSCTATSPQACRDSGLGTCQGSGITVCNAAGNGVTCRITTPGATATAEICDGLDNNCDGTIDNGGASDPARVREPMVAISGGGVPQTVYVYTYEASRADASASSAGALGTRACSKAGALPWTNVTHAEAQAACQAAGKRLCTEAEWQRACQTAAATACTWSYAASCGTSAATTCNTHGFDGDAALSGDQDVLVPAGSRLSCYADWGAAGHIFDLTGNAKEWTAARSPGVNPLRGGSYVDLLDGATCGFSFVAVGNSYKLGNTGFRCCSDSAP